MSMLMTWPAHRSMVSLGLPIYNGPHSMGWTYIGFDHCNGSYNGLNHYECSLMFRVPCSEGSHEYPTPILFRQQAKWILCGSDGSVRSYAPGSSLDELVEDWQSQLSVAINEIVLQHPLYLTQRLPHELRLIKWKLRALDSGGAPMIKLQQHPIDHLWWLMRWRESVLYGHNCICKLMSGPVI